MGNGTEFLDNLVYFPQLNTLKDQYERGRACSNGYRLLAR